MKELIDLYAKLVIGTFTFIGPSFTLLISLFSRQIERSTSENKVRIQVLISLDGESKALLKQLSENRKYINLLKPKRQVIRLFGVLLLALIFIGFYYFQHSHFWQYKEEWIRITTILASVALYLYSILVLWQVFCIIITAKLQEEEENKQKQTTSLQTEKKISHE